MDYASAIKGKAFQKYLSTYAEPEIKALGIKLSFRAEVTPFEALLVLPVFDESIENLNHFIALESKKSVAMIWVFNCPDNANSNAQARTVQLMRHFNKVLDATQQGLGSGLYFAEVNKKLTIYLFDRCSKGKLIPSKQGVGLARKLGMDLGLMLIDQQFHQYARQVNWIHSTDADVTLPVDYFDISVNDESCSAVIYPFQHMAENGYEQAIALYDFSLRYYVERLAWAGSPYAFHTIGSLVAVTPLAYVQVRGMPKRSGAEDFYILNKLAKVGNVISLDAPIIRISGRASHRVPFGTGPALSKIKTLNDPLSEYRFYHPDIFEALKAVLAIVSGLEQSISSADVLFSRLRARLSANIAEHVITTLQALKLEKQFQHLSQKSDARQFIQAFHTWFDAFVTLRFIHIMRDLAYPNVTLEFLKKYGVNIEYYQRS